MNRSSRYYLRLVIVAGLVLIISIVTNSIWPTRGTAQPTKTYHFDLPALPTSIAPIPQISEKNTDPRVAAQTAMLMDGESGVVLYAKQPDVAVPIASTTKLITALVVRDKLSLDQVVAITREQISVIGSDMGLRPGEKLSVRSLLTGLLVASGNDAGWALAETASGTKEAFVAEMNKKATDLGLTVTHYSDPVGLDPASKSTAFELALIARAALADSVIAEIVRLPEVTITSTDGLVRHELKNSNRLVNDYAYLGAIGLKTGYTPEAGHCLVGAADRSGHRLIAVILHTNEETITASANEARKLLDWGWANARWD